MTKWRATMELYQIRTFLEIVKTGNLTQAAAHLNTSQPAVSAQIKALEKEFGFALFYRTPKGMQVTEKGAQLIEKAQEIYGAINGLHEKVSSLHSPRWHALQLGLNTDGEILQIKKMIELATTSVPSLELHLIKTRSEDLIQDLTTSKIDAGFYYGENTDTRIIRTKLQTFKMFIVYPQGWHARIKNASLSQLSQFPWIWTTRGCPFYKSAAAVFQQHHLNLKKTAYVDDESTIGKLVKAEMGCSLLAEPVAVAQAAQGGLKILNSLDIDIDLNFAFLKDKKDAPALLQAHTLVKSLWK
jgi:DNA-binding transcriptional LysR family regulator